MDELEFRGKGKRAVLFVNTHSRRGQESFELAKDHLHEFGIELASANSMSTVKELKRGVESAVTEGVPLVIAGGGDGTFSAIAGYFVGSRSTLGVLPLGTGNAFARDLGIGADIRAACQIVAEGKRTEVDLGIANGDYFINVATIGLTTRIALGLTDPMKRRFGRMVYAVAIAQALFRIQPFHVRLETDTGVNEFETLLVVLGNGRYHAGPFLLSPSASIVDGKLVVYALATARKSAFLKFALALASGRQGDLPEVIAESPVSGVVTTTPERRVTVDGEVRLRTPLKFSVAPRALPVMAPQNWMPDG